MSQKVAPWLDGLNEGAWEYSRPPISNNVSSASHDATSIRSDSSRSKLPRRSLSGLPSMAPNQTSSSKASTQIKRSPLATLTDKETNTFRKQNGSIKGTGARSVSQASDGQSLPCGTVQYRSKSASPTKQQQQTLEWRRRLVNGEVGYGDQTDLFGPSGLENIFARSKGPENEAPEARNRMNWLRKSDSPIPSSPPQWPSNSTDPIHSDVQQRSFSQESESLEVVREDGQFEDDEQAEYTEEPNSNESSDQFNLDAVDGEGAGQDTNADSSELRHHNDQHLQEEQRANRTVSGQTELEQEDFSPVFISKHTTVNGQVNYAALDSHLVKQFNSVKVSLRHPSQVEPQRSDANDNTPNEGLEEQSAFTDGPDSDMLPAAPDLSLSENLPTGTPPVKNLGMNVELKRGGYSAYGSFNQRPLSPSPSKTEDSVNRSVNDLLSPTESSTRRPSTAQVPSRSPATPQQSHPQQPPKSRPSGSPLKLFGAHDTFTNNRLLRRMSQLEPGDAVLRNDDPVNEVAQATQRQVSQSYSDNSFGSGRLNEHTFNAEITITSASDSEKDDSNGSPGSEVPVPGCKEPIGFRGDIPPESAGTFKLKRKLSKQSTANSKGSTLRKEQNTAASPEPTTQDVSEFDAYFERAEQLKAYDGGSKRPPTSPFKNPTPKRRRTLQASELEMNVAKINDSYRSQTHEAASGKKRRDARPGESQSTADADVLAQRKILRPRNPTPSQRRKQQIEAQLIEAAEDFAAQEPEQLEAVLEQIESSMAGSDGPQTLQQQAEVVATEVANFSLRVQKPSGEHGERKRSVTTQDFLNEAMMVMQLIRAKARPQSGLGSVEESDAEGLSQSLQPDGSLQSTGEPLRVSRPPSREGRHSGWRSALEPQTNARVVSHLRRFQEKDDTEFIADSIASLHVDDEESLNDNVVVVDEHSNIRISGPHAEQFRDDSDDSRPVSQRSQSSAYDTQASNGVSTGRTTGTSSTRKSENVGTLAPDAVAHLIGDQVGGMTFDRDSQRWIRVKSPNKTNTFLEPPSQLTSDDDPFREISDLPVDEQNELRRISGQEEQQAPLNETSEIVDYGKSSHDEEIHQPAVESRMSSNETVITQRPVTRDSSHTQTRIHHMHSSSVPSRHTALASSQQVDHVETRATSWSDEELVKLSAASLSKQQPLAYAAAQATLALRGAKDAIVERSSNDPLDVSVPMLQDESEHRPAESYPKDNVSGSLRNDTAFGYDESDVESLASPKLRRTQAKVPHAPAPSFRAPNRQMSLRKRTLTTGFNAEAYEQSELSLIAALPGERMMSLSLSVSKPLTTRQAKNRQIVELQSSPSKSDPNATFLLSDLPDFTIHEELETRPSERALATRLAQHAATGVDDQYALAVKDLIKTLTDVQEGEPYWEDVKQLDLHDRALSSLYGLSDFCTKVQHMDVSDNALTHLQGAPYSVRSLTARSNQLSSLTCWASLMNLQYLDISDNKLDSLVGLSYLVHLRELRADNNQIVSLDGIMELDGLLKVRLRSNRIEGAVDFTGNQLHRLTELDLSTNHIQEVHLGDLKSLVHVRLDGNPLSRSPTALQKLPSVESLSMVDCGLTSLDVSNFPQLRMLRLDNNALADVAGVEKLKVLDTLSMRHQSLPEDKTISILDHSCEARILQLSGNALSTFNLNAGFLSLQHLELASVGLQELPPDFGLKLPNLRSLNLNFNALKDIRPLLNIQNLEHLGLCGNRLSRLRKSIATLARLSSLRTLDLRDNPMTQGFYPPSGTTHTHIVRRQACPQTAAEEDDHAELMELAKYSLPEADGIQDRQHQSRLDEDTRLRRRVYELLLAHSCPALERVDGLGFRRDAADVKDEIWRRLVELGVLRKSSAA